MFYKELTDSIKACLNCHLVPFIQGSPGIGKSDIVKAIAESRKLKVIDVRLSQCDPTDLSGLPRFNGDKAEFVPFDIFPLEGAAKPKGFDGWLVFLDEINSASRAVQAAAYKLVLDRMVGQKKLHPDVFVICAGNKDTDNAITNNLSTALRSRFITLPLEIDYKQWLEWATDNKVDFRITSFIAYKGLNGLCDFDPERSDSSYACPRTWVMADKLVKEMTKRKVPLADFQSLFEGTVGNIASEFLSFAEVTSLLPDMKNILNGSEHPKDDIQTGLKYLIMGYVAEHSDEVKKEEEAKNVLDYITEFGNDFIPPFCMTAIKRNPKLPAYKAFQNAVKRFNKWLSN